MDMNDIVVIDEDNDDLEEGEITDDREPEVEVLKYLKTKPKKLPRRYDLHNRSSNSKHRNCKHKTKNKSKNSTKSYSTSLKKHRSSCPRHNLEKYPSMEQLSSAKNDLTLYNFKHRENRNYYSPSSVKSAFKNYTSPPRAASSSKKIAPSNSPNPDNEDNFSKLLISYKKAQKRNQKNEKDDSKCQHNSLEKDNTIVNDIKEYISPTRPHEKSLVNSVKEKNKNESDDEDVDELRRLALATFAKKSISETGSLESINRDTSVDLNNVSNSPSKIPTQKISESCHIENDNGSRDNYDVVDMDIDDDENFQNVSNSDLFIIDKTPASSEFSQNVSNIEHSPNHNIEHDQNHNMNMQNTTQNTPFENGTNLSSANQFKSNDDFEEELLRAELIASLNSSQRKLPSPSPCNIPLKEKLEIPNKTLNNVYKTSVAKPHSVYSKGPLRNLVKKSTKAVIQGKPKFSKLASKTVPPPRSINAAQERLIITLNNDSTTEESEEESDKNITIQENVPVSSIEALISSARQKSDVNQSKIGNSNDISCLSKAQQEEYNNLKKILAEKEPYSVPPPPIIKEKNPPDQTHLNFLIDKISDAKVTLEKEIGKRNQLQAELLRKKQTYMTSKLKVQLLKEQLHAAEKLRAANLESWKQCSAKLDVFKKSVAKWKTLIPLLESELNSRSLQLELNPLAPRI